MHNLASSPFRRQKYTVTMMIHMMPLMLLFFCSTVLSQSVVEYLPGFSGKLPFKLETGYIGVGEKEDNQLFYYFFESESNPETDPLVLWLTGGPGCSGLSAVIYEIGPITIDYPSYYANPDRSIPKLIRNEYSWTKVASIIFLDQPVGTGFSYATTQEASYSSDTLAAHHTYEFLRKWLMNNPKYLQNPLYICGDSYGGIFVPLVVDKVFEGIELGSEPRLNMKGYSLGNPITNLYNEKNGRILYAHRMGLLSDKLYESAKKACRGNYINVDQEDILCQNVLEKVNKCLNKIPQDFILDPYCEKDRNVLGNAFSYESIPASILRSPVASKKSWCRDDNEAISNIWANDESVQKALHIREGTITEWARCNNDIRGTKLYVYDIDNTTSYHKSFTHKSCRALVYSGDHDISVPHTTTERWINSLNVPIQSDWRPWFVEGQVAGYTMTYSYGGTYELTYATVKGAGHIAPEFKPKQCFSMIRSWFNHNDL